MSTAKTLRALTDADLDDHLAAATTPVLIDFWATWCGPCKTMTHVLESIADGTPAIGIVTVEVGANPESVARYGITSVPTMVLIDNGTELKRIVGANDEASLRFELNLCAD